MQATGLITLVKNSAEGPLLTVGERVKWAREQRTLSQTELAARAGVSQGTIGNVEAGLRKKPRELNAIARGLMANPDWLETGRGEWSNPGAAIAAMEPRPQYEMFGTGVAVPLLAAAASMGPGLEQHDDVVVGRLTLSPQWISKTLKPLTRVENLRFIHGYGDSMEPTFADGDILLVDAGVHDVKVDGIYVLEANERLYVKRVRQRMDASFEISSDNSTVKTVDVLDGTRPVAVLGRVVWVWNGKKM